MNKRVSRSKRKILSKRKAIPNDFTTKVSRNWHHRFMNDYEIDPNKPVIFLPCSERQPFYDSQTHKVMKVITGKDEIDRELKGKKYTRLVLDEPLGIVPYEWIDDAPFHNFAPRELDDRQRQFFVDRTRDALLKIKRSGINHVYYVGGKHHDNILHDAAKGLDIEVICRKPVQGYGDYDDKAREIVALIEKEGKYTG